MSTTVLSPASTSVEGVQTFNLRGAKAAAVKEYLRLAALRREAEAAEKAAREAVESFLPSPEFGEKQIVQINGVGVMSRKPFWRDNVPIKTLKEQQPEVFALFNSPILVSSWRTA